MKRVEAGDHTLSHGSRFIDRGPSQLRVHRLRDALTDGDAPVPYSGHGAEVQFVVVTCEQQVFLAATVLVAELNVGGKSIGIEPIGDATLFRYGIHHQRNTLVIVAMGDNQNHRPSMSIGHTVAPPLKGCLCLGCSANTGAVDWIKWPTREHRAGQLTPSSVSRWIHRDCRGRGATSPSEGYAIVTGSGVRGLFRT